jgi:hypothetical protein
LLICIHYKTAYTLAHILGHKSLDNYVSYMLVQNIEMEVRGGARLVYMRLQ